MSLERVQPAAAITPAMLVNLLWRGKWLIVAGTLLGLLGSIAYLHLATPRYMAYLQLVPTEQSGVQVARNISGLASLAGINLPRGGTPQFAFVLETMKGRDVAEAVAQNQPLMRRLFAASWNPATGRWEQPEDRLHGIESAIKTVLAMPQPAWTPPGALQVQRQVQKRLSITEDNKHSIATITLTHPDPAIARDLLAAVYEASDTLQRARMERRTVAYIDYISHKLLTVQLAEHRAALANALAEQERMLMMARTGQPFAADPLGMVSVTDKPVSPNMVIALAAGLVLGGLMGIGAAIFMWWRRGQLTTA